jgi:hypothetical protein
VVYFYIRVYFLDERLKMNIYFVHYTIPIVLPVLLRKKCYAKPPALIYTNTAWRHRISLQGKVWLFVHIGTCLPIVGTYLPQAMEYTSLLCKDKLKSFIYEKSKIISHSSCATFRHSL